MNTFSSLTLLDNNFRPKFYWSTFFILFNSIFFWKDRYSHTLYSYLYENNFAVKNSIKIFNLQNELVYKFLKQLNRVSPIFALYIYKVDKRIYKNTRGKSGKFTFLWKYVAVYKRHALVMSWLVKELSTKNLQTFDKRLKGLLRLLFFDVSKLWVFKIQKFSHNYVYWNCRKTLAETYITTKN
jgi:hypothetical protein